MIQYKQYTKRPWSWLTLWSFVLTICSQPTKTTSLPDNPMDKLLLGSMTVVGSAAQIFENGAAIRKEHEFQLPFVEMHSKTAIGMGNAMRETIDSNESSDENDKRRRRRKRQLMHLGHSNKDDNLYESNIIKSSTYHSHHHRNKRAPCKIQTTESTSDDLQADDETARKRRRNATRSRTRTKRQKSKKTFQYDKELKMNLKRINLLTAEGNLKKLMRKRRDTNDGTGYMSTLGKELSDHAQQFAERIHGAFQSFVQTMSEMTQGIRQTFNGKSER